MADTWKSAVKDEEQYKPHASLEGAFEAALAPPHQTCYGPRYESWQQSLHLCCTKKMKNTELENGHFIYILYTSK